MVGLLNDAHVINWMQLAIPTMKTLMDNWIYGTIRMWYIRVNVSTAVNLNTPLELHID